MRKVVLSFLSLLIIPAVALSHITPKEITTPGGLKVWYLQDKNTPVIALSFAFEGGARSNPKGKEGLAEISAAILGEGTKDKDSKTVSNFVQDHAISLGFKADIDNIEGSLTLLKDHKDKAFSLLHETLTSPRIKKETLEKVRHDALTSLANVAMDPSYLVSRKLESIIFPDHPYGRPALGTRETIKNINMKDVESYLRSNLVKNHLTLAITGNITEEEAIRYIDMVFGNLPLSKALPDSPKVVSPIIKGQTEHIQMDIPQSIIVFALPGVMYDDPNFIEASILMQIMGGGQLSRLFQEIREKRGLAYAVGANLVWNQESGFLNGFAGTTYDKADSSIGLIRQEWQKLKTSGVTEQELRAAKTYIINSYPLRFTDSKSIANILVGYQRAKRPIDYFQKREGMISKVTLKDINKFVQQIIEPEKMALVTVGKSSKDENTVQVSKAKN